MIVRVEGFYICHKKKKNPISDIRLIFLLIIFFITFSLVMVTVTVQTMSVKTADDKNETIPNICLKRLTFRSLAVGLKPHYPDEGCGCPL